MLKILVKFTAVLAALYGIICLILYFLQEKLIFFPQKLPKNYVFLFHQKFEEQNIEVSPGVSLNSLLFKVDSPRGVIFYLHGNAGALNSWGEVAGFYNHLGYDLLMIDYRGYGKSDGQISNQAQLFSDIQTAYDRLKEKYAENKIIVLGYSIGTGMAAKIASQNNPGLLILQAPYYSLVDLVKHSYPFLPVFLLKYKFETNKYLGLCKTPVILFHGDKDEVIYFQSSVRLSKLLKPNDQFISLPGQGHNGMSNNPYYRQRFAEAISSRF
jgi:alpha-beta hydrolase superfamily lysophospholipase